MSAIQSWDRARRCQARRGAQDEADAVVRRDRIILGLLFLAKAAHLALATSSPWDYGLAALLVAGGLVWIVEGAKGFRARLTAEEPVPGPIR